MRCDVVSLPPVQSSKRGNVFSFSRPHIFQANIFEVRKHCLEALCQTRAHSRLHDVVVVVVVAVIVVVLIVIVVVVALVHDWHWAFRKHAVL